MTGGQTRWAHLPKSYFYRIKVRTPGARRFTFVTARNGVSHFRINARLFRDEHAAETVLTELKRLDPTSEFRLVRVPFRRVTVSTGEPL